MQTVGEAGGPLGHALRAVVKLLPAVDEVVESAFVRVTGSREALDDLVDRLRVFVDSVGEFAGTVGELLGAVGQFRGLLVELVQPAGQLCGTRRQLSGTVGEVRGTGLEFAAGLAQLVHPRSQLTGAARGLVRALLEPFGAFVEFPGGVAEVLHLLAHLVEADVDVVEVGLGHLRVEGRAGHLGDGSGDLRVQSRRCARDVDVDLRLGRRFRVVDRGHCAGEAFGDRQLRGVLTVGQPLLSLVFVGDDPVDVVLILAHEAAGELSPDRHGLAVDLRAVVVVDDGRLDGVEAVAALPGGEDESGRHDDGDEDQAEEGEPVHRSLRVRTFESHDCTPSMLVLSAAWVCSPPDSLSVSPRASG